ncbi:katanin p80 WD40 repeat-containing subunit B1 homolog KTN80.1-like [Silene latifolia]|uniref:katanin p80 WD40 repeat-containing subunit B1 homolog KTN80.1-like n=1 Tax=Silene latifolia TaxID=37657 RepID=UPI003D76AC9D
MAKRGYKLQEFLAHSGNVNCLRIGKKACRLLLTGGDDHKVNLWSIGKPTSLMSLCGHNTPVESLAFDSAETLVLGGAASGTVKLWDLEEAKVVRTLTGHRSNCTSVEFHPFGEFFASGSADTNLKIWDIRKRGCIFTYKGHNLGINTIKFSPDGRWVVSGGFDNVVKIWDLTAGKLLHDLKLHNGHIRSIDFHPVEFLMATGSADKTVKFWDLETFEMTGSTKPEAIGVRAVTFHPDGRTLFSGYDNNLKVYSWEPVICHDAINMGWSTLGDLCINDGKLIGCSYYRNSIGVWVADVSRVAPYGTSNSGPPQDCSIPELKLDIEGKQSAVEVILPATPATPSMPSSGLHSSSDVDDKDIKNIYVDYEKPISTRRTGLLNRSKSLTPSSSDTKEPSKLSSSKQSTPSTTRGKSNDSAGGRSFYVTNLIPRESVSGRSSTNARRESLVPTRPGSKGTIKAADMISKPNGRFDVDGQDMLVVKNEVKELVEDKNRTVEKVEDRPQWMVLPVLPSKLQSGFEPMLLGLGDGGKGSIKAADMISKPNGRFNVDGKDMLVVKDEAKELVEDKYRTVEKVEDKPQVMVPPVLPSKLQSGISPLDCDEVHTVNVVKRAGAHGRIQSLVQKFERSKQFDSSEDSIISAAPEVMVDRIKRSTTKEEPQVSGRELTCVNETSVIEGLMQNHDVLLSSLRSRLTDLQMVRHLWERNDIKGAINALMKLSDHSVQADVIGVLMEKMEIVTMDLFSCMIPVLVSLLDSKIERHAKMSLEMLLKLVALFGPIIQSTISAPPSVGMDLHKDERIECCKKCATQLHQIQGLFPTVARRSGSLAKSALELSLVLQDHNL